MELTRITAALTLAAALLPAAAGARTAGARTAGASPLEGVYRVAWTATELTAAGATRQYVHSSCPSRCLLTMTLRAGHVRIHGGPPPDYRATYATTGNAVSFVAGHYILVARWSLSGRTLRLHVTKATDPGDGIIFGAKPWTKIG